MGKLDWSNMRSNFLQSLILVFLFTLALTVDVLVTFRVFASRRSLLHKRNFVLLTLACVFFLINWFFTLFYWDILMYALCGCFLKNWDHFLDLLIIRLMQLPCTCCCRSFLLISLSISRVWQFLLCSFLHNFFCRFGCFDSVGMVLLWMQDLSSSAVAKTSADRDIESLSSSRLKERSASLNHALVILYVLGAVALFVPESVCAWQDNSRYRMGNYLFGSTTFLFLVVSLFVVDLLCLFCCTYPWSRRVLCHRFHSYGGSWLLFLFLLLSLWIGQNSGLESS